LSKKLLSSQLGIPYSTLTGILNTPNIIPEIITLLKIANYFTCSIDEVIGRKEYILYDKKFINLDIVLLNITTSIKTFIINNITQNNLNVYNLSRSLDLGENVIYEFIKKDSHYKVLSTRAIINLADYFMVPVDELIGRSVATNSLEQ
jgi:hypothetical protein